MVTGRVKSIISSDADAKVVALSDIIVTGTDRRIENRLNARMKLSSVRLGTFFRCTARNDAHVNKQMYAFDF